MMSEVSRYAMYDARSVGVPQKIRPNPYLLWRMGFRASEAISISILCIKLTRFGISMKMSYKKYTKIFPVGFRCCVLKRYAGSTIMVKMEKYKN